MSYRHNPYKRRSQGRIWYALSTVVILTGLTAAFVVGVKEFRAKKPEDAPLVESIAHVMKPSPLLLSVEEQKEIVGVEKAVLREVGGDRVYGRALREDKDGVFSLEVNADLPEIDRESWYYEVWLLRPVPFEFFSAGEMVTDDLADFVLEFEGDPRGDYSGFTRVIITKERYAGPEDPGDHVAEGVFES